MEQTLHLIQEVNVIYQWLETKLVALGQSCAACGQCCDFESFGHRLYVTTPELIYFQHFAEPNIKPMTTGVCPYRIDGKCTVYEYRFAGCRIFTCKGDSEEENQVCEEVVHRFKALCDDNRITYRYIDLKTGLQLLKKKSQLKIDN